MKTRLVGILFVTLALALTTACTQPDSVITGKVKTKLAADRDVSAFEINVDTAAGVVTLTGNLDDPYAKERALTLARETKGVKQVVDMLSTRRADGTGNPPHPGRTLGQGIDDATITMAVKSRLLADPEVKGLDIDVDTRNGVVYLTGSVGTADERNHAIELASNTAHVREVQANLSIKAG